jgi:hypothetical protein
MQSRVFPYFVLVSRRLPTVLLRCTFATASAILDIVFTYPGKRYGDKLAASNLYQTMKYRTGRPVESLSLTFTVRMNQ